MRVLKAVICVALILGFFQNTWASDTVINEIVREWILTSLSVNYPPSQASEELIQKNYSLGKVEYAWSQLKNCRDAGNSLDLNLAAAEHYMFARYMSSDDGDTNYRELPKWYESFKKLATKLELENYIQSSDQPISQPNDQVTRWGEKGVEHGLNDYETRKGRKPYQRWWRAPWMAINFAAYVYYKQEPEACELSLKSEAPLQSISNVSVE